MYFGGDKNEFKKIYQELVKDKKKGSVITKEEIRDCAHRHIADPAFMDVDNWMEEFIEIYKLS